jgi:hypothetical protein
MLMCWQSCYSMTHSGPDQSNISGMLSSLQCLARTSGSCCDRLARSVFWVSIMQLSLQMLIGHTKDSFFAYVTAIHLEPMDTVYTCDSTLALALWHWFLKSVQFLGKFLLIFIAKICTFLICCIFLQECSFTGSLVHDVLCSINHGYYTVDPYIPVTWPTSISDHFHQKKQ